MLYVFLVCLPSSVITSTRAGLFMAEPRTHVVPCGPSSACSIEDSSCVDFRSLPYRGHHNSPSCGCLATLLRRQSAPFFQSSCPSLEGFVFHLSCAVFDVFETILPHYEHCHKYEFIFSTCSLLRQGAVSPLRAS